MYPYTTGNQSFDQQHHMLKHMTASQIRLSSLIVDAKYNPSWFRTKLGVHAQIHHIIINETKPRTNCLLQEQNLNCVCSDNRETEHRIKLHPFKIKT